MSNIITLNTTSLDGGVIIKKGGGGTSPAPMPSAPIAENDVTFYDYDGKVLYAYTKEEFLALTAMPTLPTREGLICQEWNWTWEDAYNYVSKYGICDIGATYTTDDGSTKVTFDITLKERLGNPAMLAFNVDADSEIVVDWGDGSPLETFVEGESQETRHCYTSIGKYIASIKATKGAFTFNWLYDYPFFVTEINFGDNVTLNSYSLNNLGALKALSFAKNINLNKSVFYDNPYITCLVIPSATKKVDIQYGLIGLKTLCLPSTTTELVKSDEEATYNMFKFCIPQGVIRLEKGQFQNANFLSVVIPNGVASIGDSAFSGAYYLNHLDFSQHTHIPTLGANAIESSPTGEFEIIVPDNLYDSWKSATNWSTYAKHIVKKSDWDASQTTE